VVSPDDIISYLVHIAMQIRLASSQSVEIAVTEQPIPIQHYLRQPHRLIKALVDPSRSEQLNRECFRLKMRPINFMMFNIQPTVDMRLWADSTGTIHLQSVRCEILGVEYINQRFHLNLVGKLAPLNTGALTTLIGRADLEVQVDLPPALWLTPKPFLETTGNGILRSVLLTIKQRLMHQLLSDYYRWVSMQELEADKQIIPMGGIGALGKG
jgi:Protein of unknown function (DUF1997)